MCGLIVVVVALTVDAHTVCCRLLFEFIFLALHSFANEMLYEESSWLSLCLKS